MDKSLFFDFGIKIIFADDPETETNTYELIDGSYENIKNALINGKIVTGYSIGFSGEGNGCEFIGGVQYLREYNAILVLSSTGDLFILEDNTIVTELGY